MNYPKYKVYVSCMTFNQAKFITDALNGFAMQQTTFPFVCTIVDDASTDGEQEVISKYVEKNFDLDEGSVSFHKETEYAHITYAQHKKNRNCYFAILYLKENHYSKKKDKCQYLKEWIDGIDYVAICEGDDYWTDPLKLQKQVDFLESHPDYSMCFHTAIQHWEDGCKPDEIFKPIEDREYTGEELFAQWTTATASVMLRRSVLKSDIYKMAQQNKKFIYGDIVTWLSAAHEGKVWGMSDVMSVYRKQSEGVTAKYSSEHIKDQAYHSLEIYKVFGEQYKRISIDKFAIDAMDAFFGQKADGRIDYSLLCDLIRYAPKQTISKFVSMVAGKIFI